MVFEHKMNACLYARLKIEKNSDGSKFALLFLDAYPIHDYSMTITMMFPGATRKDIEVFRVTSSRKRTHNV